LGRKFSVLRHKERVIVARH